MVKNSPANQCRRHSFDPWVRKIPWRRAWQPTSVFLPGEAPGQRSLTDHGPQGQEQEEKRLPKGKTQTHKVERLLRTGCILLYAKYTYGPLNYVTPFGKIPMEVGAAGENGMAIKQSHL